MDLGKPVKAIAAPERAPARQPRGRPQRREGEQPILLPADWPVRSPVQASNHGLRDHAGTHARTLA